MIRMVISDVDGTLLPHSTQTLDPGLLEEIHRLTSQGIRFVAASGRQYANLYRLFGPVQDEIAYIPENGALTIYQDQVLDMGALPKELVLEIAEAIWNTEGAEFSISGARTYYIRPKSEEFLWLMRDFMHNEIRLIEDFSQVPDDCLKVSLFDRQRLEERLPLWQERFSDRAYVVTSGNDWLDFMPKGVNKGRGVGCLQKLWGISPGECMAFGDEHNDIEMLKAVEHSFAVTTARERVKAVSRYMTEDVGAILKELPAWKGKQEGKL